MDWVAAGHESGVRDNRPYRMHGDGPDSLARGSQRFPPPLPGNAPPQSLTNTADGAWPQRVLDEMKDMLLLLSSDGTVMYASPSCSSITGYDASDLQKADLARFIHKDDQDVFLEDLNECIVMARPVHCHFRFCAKDQDAFCTLEAYGHPHMKTTNQGNSTGDGIQECIGVFLLCRPYPTKSSQQIDSFLEHKIENVRLAQRIAQLKQGEEEDLAANNQQAYSSDSKADSMSGQNPGSSSGRSNSNQSIALDATASGEENESSDTLTNDDLDVRPYQEGDTDKKRLQTEDMAHIRGIEMMTGLHYGEGERSQGLSTGLLQGRLIHFDMESAKLEQQTRIIQDSERKKRQKGEYMCSDCGTSDSPEWRKGPEGPKTLCNACGLRWAKKEKKRQDHV
ncbi:hypothetical protein BDV25DRAFT_141933 [Aspergillus avenaceus]|uniref:GATA-domain-containing protein n=1 Tax=Aspergillus avenaceus TaxID=36643 RepID=A0A5N6TQB4_ASPAV|nr:hypothetical protein BDV25DRAFT_141933 [Aspergillus avenaceus]